MTPPDPQTMRWVSDPNVSLCCPGHASPSLAGEKIERLSEGGGGGGLIFNFIIFLKGSAFGSPDKDKAPVDNNRSVWRAVQHLETSSG